MPKWAHANYWRRREEDNRDSNYGQQSPWNPSPSHGRPDLPTPLPAASKSDNNAGPYTVADLPADSELKRATLDFLTASQNLYKTLEDRQSAEPYFSDLPVQLQYGGLPPPLPFSSIVRSTQKNEEAKKNVWTGQAASFLSTLYPTMKTVLGLTGTVAGGAGFGPLQTSANGLAQVLEVSCKYLFSEAYTRMSIF